MAEGAFEFLVSPDCRAGVAVYAVAMGDYLGMDLDRLKRLRKAVEESELTGEEELDEILIFVLGDRETRKSRRLIDAAAAVETLIQPLSVGG